MKKVIAGLFIIAALSVLCTASGAWYDFSTTNSVGLYTEERVRGGYLAGCTKFSPEQLSILFLPDGSLSIRISVMVGNSDKEAPSTVPISKDDLIEIIGEDGVANMYATFVGLMEKVIIYKRSQP